MTSCDCFRMGQDVLHVYMVEVRGGEKRKEGQEGVRAGREEQVETKGGEGGCNVFHGLIFKSGHCLTFVAL